MKLRETSDKYAAGGRGMVHQLSNTRLFSSVWRIQAWISVCCILLLFHSKKKVQSFNRRSQSLSKNRPLSLIFQLLCSFRKKAKRKEWENLQTLTHKCSWPSINEKNEGRSPGPSSAFTISQKAMKLNCKSHSLLKERRNKAKQNVLLLSCSQ